MALDLRNKSGRFVTTDAECLEAGDCDADTRHLGSSETCVCARGHFEEYSYDSEERLMETVNMVLGGAEYQERAVV